MITVRNQSAVRLALAYRRRITQRSVTTVTVMMAIRLATTEGMADKLHLSDGTPEHYQTDSHQRGTFTLATASLCE